MRVLLYGVALGLVVAANAQDKKSAKVIKTGGEKGAYHTQFAPPLMPKLRQAQFSGYALAACEPNKPCGSPANIEFVAENPASVGFAQLDVFSKMVAEKPELGQRLTIAKQFACESIVMFTKNPSIENYGDVLGLARRLPFVIAGGGAQVTWENMRRLDPDGIGRARNVEFAADGAAVVRAISGNEDAVGMIVQFADPSSPNMKAIADAKLRGIGVSSRELARARVGDTKVYEVRQVDIGTTKNVPATCTPVALITGRPDVFSNKDDADDQRDLLALLQKTPESDLLPKEGALASFLKTLRSMSADTIEAINEKIEQAKKNREKQG